MLYVCPLFKIHKVKPEELLPGVRPSIRLVTAQKNGPFLRSDKFLMFKALEDLQEDYCSDLVKDITDALIKMQRREPVENSRSFVLDVVALYDDINP